MPRVSNLKSRDPGGVKEGPNPAHLVGMTVPETTFSVTLGVIFILLYYPWCRRCGSTMGLKSPTRFGVEQTSLNPTRIQDASSNLQGTPVQGFTLVVLLLDPLRVTHGSPAVEPHRR